MYLARKLELNFVKPRATIFVRRPLEPKKDIGLGVILIYTWG
jgi:hypothetical protein